MTLDEILDNMMDPKILREKISGAREADAVSFGKYLLSDERADHIYATVSSRLGVQRTDEDAKLFDETIQRKLREVTEVDLVNWRGDKDKVLERVFDNLDFDSTGLDDISDYMMGK